MRKSTRQQSGGKRLRASGRKPILLGVTPEQHDLFRRAADADNRPITQLLIHYGIIASKKILGKD